jgi:E3 ubiquitin-protein ligase NRDP1
MNGNSEDLSSVKIVGSVGGTQRIGKGATGFRLMYQPNSMYPDFHEFYWDPEHSSKEIRFSQDLRHVFLFESTYLFRTAISSRPFMDGIHYWEIIADARTEHELKIGVTTQQKFCMSNAFCDYEFGFAFYGMG